MDANTAANELKAKIKKQQEHAKLHPGLRYPREIIPPEIMKVINDARLMPHVYQNPKSKKWVCGYRYTQAMALIGTSYQQYVTKLVADGVIHLEGSMPNNWDEENQTTLTLLNVYDVEKKADAYHPRDSDYEGRTYEIKGVDPEQWQELSKILDKMGIQWKDLTEARRNYARKHRAAQKSQHAKTKKTASRPTETIAERALEEFAAKLEEAVVEEDAAQDGEQDEEY